MPGIFLFLPSLQKEDVMFKKVYLVCFFCLFLTSVHLFTDNSFAETKDVPSFLLDYQQKDEVQKQVKDSFDAEKYDELERLVSQFRNSKERFVGGDWKLEYFYLGLRTAYKLLDTTRMMGKEVSFQKWLTAYPNSSSARIAYADYLKEVAWKYRGDGYADSVSLEGRKKFDEYLAKIPSLFEEAQNLSEKDVHLYAVMITVGNALGWHKDQLSGYLNKGLVLNADYFPLYLRMTTVLLPRWQGEIEEVEKFADIALTARGEGYYALIADKARSYVGWDDYLKFQFSWEKIKAGFDELLSQHPASFYYLNAYAMFACIYKDKIKARELFERIGDLWDGNSQVVWQEKKYLNTNKAWSFK